MKTKHLGKWLIKQFKSVQIAIGFPQLLTSEYLFWHFVLDEINPDNLLFPFIRLRAFYLTVSNLLSFTLLSWKTFGRGLYQQNNSRSNCRTQNAGLFYDARRSL